MSVFALLLAVANLSCFSSATTLLHESDDSNLLPDLIIKRVGFQTRETGSRLVPQRIEVLVLPCELRVQIDNIGNSAFDKPFYLSFTTTVPDYQNFIYSKHELLNEGRTVILPRKSFTFVVSTEIEVPRRTSGNIPLRLYINTEGNLNKLGYQAPRIDERDYSNNVFEVSLRLPRR